MKTWWEIFKCRLFGIAVGESVYTETGEYAGLLWTNIEQRKKYIVVCWDFDDEFCPVGLRGKELELGESL